MDDIISAIPICYRTYNPLLFMFQLIFVFLLLCGIWHLWETLQKFLKLNYKNPFIELSLAVVVINFLIFPIFFLFSLYGWFRQFLICLQISLLFFSFYNGYCFKFARKFTKEFRLLAASEVTVLIYIVFFIYWSWVMPFTESFNGHFCVLVNMIQNMWKSGSFAVIEKPFVSYDNAIFAWPANLAFFLSTFTMPYIKPIDIRPIFIIPGVLSFLSWRLFRANSGLLFKNERWGDLAFLMVIFSYHHFFNAMIYFDMFSPLIISLFMFFFIKVFKEGKMENLPFLILLLSFSFMIRKQIFLMFFVILSIAFLFLVLKIRDLKPIFKFKKLFVFLFLLPTFFWGCFVYINYGSPFFPHDTSFTYKLFPAARQEPKIVPFTIDKPIPTSGEGIRNTSFPAEKSGRIEEKSGVYAFGPKVNFYLENFFPIHFNKGVAVFLKNIFCGVTLSLLLTIGFIGFLVMSFMRIGLREARSIILIFLIGYSIIMIGFFLGYARYAQYLAYIIAPFSAYFYCSALKKKFLWNCLAFVIFMFGMFSWSYNEWGHMSAGVHSENIKFLNPYYKNVVSRMAKKSNRTEKDIEVEIREILDSRRKKAKILYADHEPGLLIPTIMNLENFAQALFLENPKVKKIYQAGNLRELIGAIEEYNITHIYKPGRTHYDFDNTLLLLMLKQVSEYKFLVPLEGLSKIRL